MNIHPSINPVGRLKSYAQDLGGTAGDLAVNGPGSGGTAITYNPASQLTGITRSNPTDLYAWTGHYNINRAYGTNGLNQLTSAGATALGYDGRGNLTSSGSSLYSYTSENRLATAPGGATLTYDPTGRLSRVTQGINDTKFEHLGPRLIIERNGAGTILRRYVHGPGDDEPVVWYEGANLSQRRFLHTDERGSVIAVTDATGASIATNRYDEYGIPQSSVGTLAPGTSGRFMYTGQIWIPELGLYYYKARFYSPTLGRFMQTDPIGYEDGVNWYAYVKSDPINAKDPSGLCGNSCTFRQDKEDKDNSTTLVKSERISASDAQGRPNTANLDNKIESYSSDAKNLTKKSDYTREYAVTASHDKKANQYVVSLFQGPKVGYFESGGVQVVPSDRLILFLGHTHTGLASEGGATAVIRAGWEGRKLVHVGASPEDIRAASYWRKVNPNIKLVVFYQNLDEKSRKWNAEEF